MEPKGISYLPLTGREAGSVCAERFFAKLECCLLLVFVLNLTTPFPPPPLPPHPLPSSCPVSARPLVRNIKDEREFDKLLKHHAANTGLPVVADFFSETCGPCRMMAPVFKATAKE